MTVEQQRDWTVWLHQQRRIVIRVSIGFILVLGFIGLVFDGIKQISTGTLSFNFTYYLLSYLAILALQLVPRIPDQWRSVGFLLVLYTFGVLSLFSGWLASSGRVFLLALVVVTVVLLSPRASSIAAALVLVTYVLFGLAFNQGWISLRQLPDPTSLSPVLLEGIGFAIGILLVSISLWYFGRALMAADRANHEAQDTRRLLDVRASQLEAANALIAQQAEAALQDSEAKFRNVIQQANDSIILCDEHGKITVWNLAAEQITGLASEQVIGRLLWEVQAEMLTIPDEDPATLERFRDPILEALQTGKSRILDRLLEGEIRRPDASRRYFQQLAFPIQTGQGYMLGTVIRDISERKQIELEREGMIRELEDKNAELERFTYTVSHDLKSPLITIQGFLGYLEKDAAAGNTERLRSDIQRINSATEKMQRLLGELLELSRIGRLMNPPVEIPFDSLVREALTLTEGRLQEGRIRVEVDSDLPTIHGDPSRLVEVLQNLIDNAAKFMGDQPDPLIHIGLTHLDGQPVFFVQDNGIGIEPRFQPKVFGLFNKLDPKTEGTGVGLALAKRIVEVHGGTIWFKSDGAGTGSTFYFTLNAAQDGPK